MHYKIILFILIFVQEKKSSHTAFVSFAVSPPMISDVNKELLIYSVLETNRAEESQSHVHKMYFMGPNTFSEPWHLPHTPPEQIKEIV